MPAEITMPQLSDTMTEGTVVKWLKKEGDKVKEGEIIAEIETDKATMEYESSESGTIARLDATEGQKVPVGQRIALIATGGEKLEDIKKSGGGAKPAAPAAEKKQPEAPAPGPSPARRQEKPAPAPQRSGGSRSATGMDKETDHSQLDRERTQARQDQTEF